MEILFYIQCILILLLAFCFVLYEIAKDIVNWILEFLHGVLQLFLILCIVMVFKLLEVYYYLRLLGHKGGVQKPEDGVPKENRDRSSTTSDSFISTYTNSTFSTSSHSTSSSTTSEESGEDNMDT
ncbi:hypothetical protein AVEN_142755-1, partial [Araneus ventricosus]